MSRLNGYVALAGREALFDIREQREQAAHALQVPAREYARWLARMPFVRMVALTGALAVGNPVDANDDLDYLVVAADDRVWIARAFAILVVRWARLFGREVCPNYVVGESQLRQRRRNLYIAHEVVQAIPFFGEDVYARLLAENAWVEAFLPNAIDDAVVRDSVRPGPVWRRLKGAAEWVLGGVLGRWLEAWEFNRKEQRFAPAAQHPDAAAEIEPGQIKGNFQDHGSRVMRRFDEQLRQHGIAYHPSCLVAISSDKLYPDKKGSN